MVHRFAIILYLMVGHWIYPSLSQTNFSKYYPVDGHLSYFMDAIVVKDTIYAQGLFKDTIAPYLQGAIFIRIDTFGNVISSQKYYDPQGRDIVYPPLVSINRLKQGGFVTVAGAFQDRTELIFILNKHFYVDTVIQLLTNDPSVQVNFFRSVFEIDDDFLIFGSAQRLDYNTDGQLIRVNKKGDILWRKFLGLSNKNEGFGDVLSYTDSTFIVASFRKLFPAQSTDKRKNTWIFEVDEEGNILQEFIDPDLFSGSSAGLVLDNTGNIYYAGSSLVVDQFGQHNALGRIGMLNKNFELQWKVNFGENHDISTGFNDMILSGNKLIAAGKFIDTTSFLNHFTTGWFGIVNTHGDSLCERFDTAQWYPGQGRSMGTFASIDTLSSGSIIACGEGWFGPEGDHHTYAWLVKMPNPPCAATTVSNDKIQWDITSTLQVSPNPSSNAIRVEWDPSFSKEAESISVFNLEGRLIKRVKVDHAIHSSSISMLSYPPGVYTVQLVSDGGYLLGLEQFVLK